MNPSQKLYGSEGDTTIKQMDHNGVKIENVDGACVLSISDCKKREHEGTYMIEVTNSLGTATEEVEVVIQAKPAGLYFKERKVIIYNIIYVKYKKTHQVE